jgi:hypothetical protein
VANRVDAAPNAVKVTGLHTPIDLALGEAQGKELVEGDDSVLARSQARERLIEGWLL